MQDKIFIGVDIGGTSIAAGCLVNNMIVKKAQADTGADRTAAEIVDTLVDVIKRVWTDEVMGIGIGVPGYMDVDKGIVRLINNIPALADFPLKDAVAEKFDVPIYINNDANCFVLGETYFGAGTKFKNVLGITLGTGLGGGVVLNGKIHSGMLSGAGEFGCIPYEGRTFEDFCSSKFFNEKYQSTGKELFIRSENGDVSAQIAFEEFGQNIGKLILQLMYTLAPDAVIIGGSIAKSFKYFGPGIFNEISSFPIDYIKKQIKILPAELNNAGIFGAAALCMSDRFATIE